MVLAPLIIDLGFILTCLVAFALCLLAILLVRGLFGTIRGTVGWIPFLGRVVTAPIHSIEQKLIDVMNKAALGTQHRVGSAFHSLEHLTIQIGESIASAMELAYAVIVVVSTLPSWHTVKALYDSLVGRDRATITTIREHTKTIHANTKAAAHANQTATAAKVRAQAIPADVVLPRDLVPLREHVREIEKRLDRLWHRVRGVDKLIVTSAFIGAVTVALGRMGLGWLRCQSLKNIGKLVGCRGFALIETLLATTIEALVVADICQLTKYMIAAAESPPVQDALSGVIAGVDELLLCQGVKRAEAMSFAAASLPPRQRWAELPA